MCILIGECTSGSMSKADVARASTIASRSCRNGARRMTVTWESCWPKTATCICKSTVVVNVSGACRNHAFT